MVLCESTSSPSCPLRILVAEDNADGRATLCALLEIFGHSVVAAEDGLEGVQKALSWHPDVALIDIGLPRMNGYQVAEQLRAAVGREVFLIAYTAYHQPEYRRQAIVAGFDAYLIKPVDLSELDHCLALAAGRRR